MILFNGKAWSLTYKEIALAWLYGRKMPPIEQEHNASQEFSFERTRELEPREPNRN